MDITGSTLFAGGEVAGTIDGRQVTFGVVAGPGVEVSFAGKIADGKIAGEWDCETVKDEGVWSGSVASDPHLE
jgi:hypothetical protein